MIMFIVLECVRVLQIFSVCLLVFGWEYSRLLILMFSLCVQIGFSVCLVSINVQVLFLCCVAVIICSVSVVLLEDFGLQILMIWFIGRLFVLSVIFSESELVEMVFIFMEWFLFRCMMEFLLNCFLIWFSVVVNVFCLFLLIVIFIFVMLGNIGQLICFVEVIILYVYIVLSVLQKLLL